MHSVFILFCFPVKLGGTRPGKCQNSVKEVSIVVKSGLESGYL